MQNRIEKSRIPKSPFILFSPFLVLYVSLVIIFPTTAIFGDEIRYLMYTDYIVHIFNPAVPDTSDFLGNGPGYPIVLIPFVALHLPLVCITLFNAVLYYLSIVLLFKTLSHFISFFPAFILSVFWACYYNLYEYIVYIYTETFTVFLICLLIFYLVKVFSEGTSKKYTYLSGFIFGYIALTKPIFGYVLMCMLFTAGLLWIMNRKVINYRRALIILLVAMATTTPYLVYTYHLTGKAFYWSSYGGNNLYWMSTPAEGEYGDWMRDPVHIDASNPRYIKGFKETILANHEKDYAEIDKYQNMERDEAFKKIAISNIKSHPVKFLQNCFCNIGRILFNYPYSYTLQKTATLIRLPMNGLVLLLSLFCIIPTFINWKKINFAVRYIFFIALLYLGGSVLGSAETRMFILAVPPLLIWIAIVLQKTIKINWRRWDD